MAKEKDYGYWIDGFEEEEPITPTGCKEASKEVNYGGLGWKFYVKIRPQLQELWAEFNSTLNKKGNGVKYKTVQDFSKAKFKDKKERELFVLMTCSYKEWDVCATTDKSVKKQVPWIGDWVKRRKNGYWMEDNSYQIENIKKAIKENLDSHQAIKATAPFIVQELMRYNRLQAKVEEVFGGTPFLDEAPVTKANRNRFAAYMEMMDKLSIIKERIICMWMRVHGVNPSEPNQMWGMAQISQALGASAAGGALGASVAQQQGFMLSNPGGPPTIISRDALLLADHITEHRNTFKEAPKEIVLEGQEYIDLDTTKDKKPNGKHSTQ